MDDVLANIMKKTINFKKTIEPQVKSLIMRILNFEPTSRPSIEEILESDMIREFLQRNPSLIVKELEQPKPFVSERSLTANKLEKRDDQPKLIKENIQPAKPINVGVIKKGSGEENIYANNTYRTTQQSYSSNKIVKTDGIRTEVFNPKIVTTSPIQNMKSDFAQLQIREGGKSPFSKPNFDGKAPSTKVVRIDDKPLTSFTQYLTKL